MAVAANISPWIIQRVVHSNEAALRRLELLEASDYPGLEPEKLIAILRRLHTLIRAEAERLAGSDAKLGHDVVATSARRLYALLMRLHSHLGFIEHASANEVLTAPLILIKGITDRIPQKKFIIVPTSDYNYYYQELLGSLRPVVELISQDANETKETLAIIDAAFPNGVAVVCYPAIEAHDIFLNTLLAHEVGHSIVEDKKLIAKIFSDDLLDSSAIDELARKQITALGPLAGPLQQFALQVVTAEWRSKAARFLQNWLRELSCDAIGALALGPAFGVPASEFFAATDAPCTESHPPGFLRLEVLALVANESGQLAALSAHNGPGHDVTKAVVEHYAILELQAKAIGPPNDPFWQALVKAARKALPRLLDAAKDALGRRCYPTSC